MHRGAMLPGREQGWLASGESVKNCALSALGGMKIWNLGASLHAPLSVTPDNEFVTARDGEPSATMAPAPKGNYRIHQSENQRPSRGEGQQGGEMGRESSNLQLKGRSVSEVLGHLHGRAAEWSAD